MVTIAQIPWDILAYMLSFSGLQDSLSFTLVCKATYSLSSERSFWIYALQNERRNAPIACTTHEDLTKRDLEELRQIAMRTLRLQQNLKSKQPKVFGDVKNLNLGLSQHDIVFPVPGTNLYIFSCPDRRTIELWDMGLQTIIGEPIEASSRILDVSSGLDLPGKFMLAFLSAESWHRYGVFVICVEHEPRNTALNLVLYREFTGKHHWGIFLDEEFVGALACDEFSNKLHVVTLSLSNKREICIEANLPSPEISLPLDQMYGSGTAVVDGDLCIICAVPQCKTWILTLPRDQLLQNNDPQSPKTVSFSFDSDYAHFHDFSSNCEDSARETMTVTTSTPYGVHAMSIDTPLPPYDDSDPVTQITFWVRSQLSGDKKLGPLVPLVLQNGVPGSLLSASDDNFWQHLFLAFSGRKGLIMSNVPLDGSGEQQILRLLSCDPAASTPVTCCDLSLPEYLDPSRIHGISFDDHLGVLSMIDLAGLLYAIPYA